MYFVAPQFAKLPEALGQRYTAWLYGDKGGNPLGWDKPELWPDCGIVSFVDQTIIVDVPVHRGSIVPFNEANTVTKDLQIGDGCNSIVYAREGWALVTPDGDPTINQSSRVPVQSWGYIWVRQRILDGETELGGTSFLNAFGTAVQPHQFPQPQMWSGAQKRKFDVSMPLQGFSVKAVMTWKIAYLNTGR